MACSERNHNHKGSIMKQLGRNVRYIYQMKVHHGYPFIGIYRGWNR